MLKNFWYACEFSSAVISKPKQIQMLGERFALYRNPQGRVVALKDQCPHRGAALSLGWVEDGCLRCPYHAWKFEADGTCSHIPANQPSVPIPRRARVDAYAVQEKYGFVWIFYGDLPEAARPPIPALPEFDDPGLHPIYYETKVNAHYTRTLENAIDFAHISVVHTGTFGNGFDREQTIEEYDVSEEAWGGNANILFQQYTKPKGFLKYVVRPSSSQVRAKISFYLPNINKLEVSFASGRLINFGTHIPIDEKTTLIKRVQFRSFLTTPMADPLFYRTNAKVSREDSVVAESEYPYAIPHNLADEVHVPSDALSLAYRKMRHRYLAMGWGIDSQNQLAHPNGHSIESSLTLIN
ncbi:aromatic ring-hydroxylating dioxygenase subunit alpha [Trichocoleus sp. FACHB-262]|uniref:aromatic ring-hydroxylating dioxygenase subunit alpha n=1 Tax=Trichocoleus sp. FACHB-262 TaxID=2692869 RepID=UPI001689AFEB|nr:aromatic ring-hydroxylating dioxygenase subunit alpha [Trichocoleus sp. FACHB-262]MBD2124590.1 aromatic ring-hydroxylating dioxygenase subunit alpha [Trichocoleus sp. FACHB-262]